VATDTDEEGAALLRSEIEGVGEDHGDTALRAVSVPVE
jgi:hypothetical protein